LLTISSSGKIFLLKSFFVLFTMMPWEAPAAPVGPRGAPTQRTTHPIVTGSSVLGIKYRDGVMLAADTLASYGTLAMFKDVERLHKVSDTTLVGAGGEFSDFQKIQHIIGDLTGQDTVSIQFTGTYYRGLSYDIFLFFHFSCVSFTEPR
jgi:hypothetical protein